MKLTSRRNGGMAPDRGDDHVGSDVLVLCYHAVSREWGADISVTPDALERQLRFLVHRGWRGTTFRDAVLAPPWRQTMAITFDDAFRSVLDLAYPILHELGLQATVFAPTAFASQRQRLRWPGIAEWADTPSAPELECMTWDDLRFLAAEGWEIGSHTRTHPHLPQLDDAALREELEGSRADCIEHLGIPCDTLAYPYGDVDARVADVAATAGYIAAGALSSSLQRRGVHRWPRIGIYQLDRMWRFRLKIDRTTRRIRASQIWGSTASGAPV